MPFPSPVGEDSDDLLKSIRDLFCLLRVTFEMMDVLDISIICFPSTYMIRPYVRLSPAVFYFYFLFFLCVARFCY